MVTGLKKRMLCNVAVVLETCAVLLQLKKERKNKTLAM